MLFQLSKFERQKLQIEQAQFVYNLAPHTLLPLSLAAAPCGKAVSSFRTDVTRRPESLPRLTRIGTRVFVRVQDLLDFINPNLSTPAAAPGARRRGRPAKIHAGG